MRKYNILCIYESGLWRRYSAGTFLSGRIVLVCVAVIKAARQNYWPVVLCSRCFFFLRFVFFFSSMSLGSLSVPPAVSQKVFYFFFSYASTLIIIIVMVVHNKFWFLLISTTCYDIIMYILVMHSNVFWNIVITRNILPSRGI